MSETKRGLLFKLRGLDITPSKLLQENIKEEISRYARNDSVGVSSRAVFMRDLLRSFLSHPEERKQTRGLLRSHCHPEPILRGVSALNRGGEQSHPPTPPKDIN